MKDYIVLDKKVTGLPVLIYIAKGDTPQIMFQNDYEDTPNPNNLIGINPNGSIVGEEDGE